MNAKSILWIPLFTAVSTMMVSAEIKPAKPRQGISPREKPVPAKPSAPAKPVQAKPNPPPDPLKPSEKILADLKALEKIYAIPEKAHQAITICNNLRSALSTHPPYQQRLNYFWAVALANSGNIDAAGEKFSAASASSAPDQVLAARALNAQAGFFLRDPAQVNRAVELTKQVIARTKPDSAEQLAARYQGACACYIQGYDDQALAALNGIDAALQKINGDPEMAKVKQNSSNLLSAIYAAKAAQNPDSTPHVFYAPWRGKEDHFSNGASRRIADLAFILRDFPRAQSLYEDLEKDAAKRSQTEVQAWARMQRARILYITGNLEDSEKLLSSFVTSSPFKEAKCASFALLRLALLYHNYLKDIPKAEKAFELCSMRFKNTPEGNVSQYYRAMVPLLQDKPKEALPLLIAYTTDHPKHPQSDYLRGNLIPQIEQQLANKQPVTTIKH